MGRGRGAVAVQRGRVWRAYRDGVAGAERVEEESCSGGRGCGTGGAGHDGSRDQGEDGAGGKGSVEQDCGSLSERDVLRMMDVLVQWNVPCVSSLCYSRGLTLPMTFAELLIDRAVKSPGLDLLLSMGRHMRT
jgi:hypothetical protein